MSQELVNSVNKLTDETSALLQEYVKGNTVLQNSASDAASSAAAAKASETNSVNQANIATQKAAESKQYRDEAAAIVTGGTATVDPAPGKIPLANSQGKISSGWLTALAFARTKADMGAMRASVNRQCAASGMIHAGKHFNRSFVNEGLSAYDSAWGDSPNKVWLGRGSSASFAIGTSLTDEAVFNIAGFPIRLLGVGEGYNGSSRFFSLPFPQAPDGTDIYDSSGNCRGTGKPTLNLLTEVDPKYGDVAPNVNEAVARAFEGLVKNGDFRLGDNGDWGLSYSEDSYGSISSEGVVLNRPSSGGITLTWVSRPALLPNTTYELVVLGDLPDDGVSLNVGSGITTYLSGRFNGTAQFTTSTAGLSIYLNLNLYEGTSAKIDAIILRSITEEVVTERVDLSGLEGYLEEITPAKPYIYPYGGINNQATSVDGIPTTVDNVRPITYFANFDGDTTSRGRGWNLNDLTDTQLLTILQNPYHHVYVIDGKLVQFRVRPRQIAGAGNGDWENFDTTKSTQLDFGGTYTRVSVQGARDSVPTFSSTRPYISKITSTESYVSKTDPALFYARKLSANDDCAYNGECYFYVLATVLRLNQGAYHPLNMLGTKFVETTAGTGSGSWHRTDIIKPINTLADCFINARASTGAIGQVSGHPEGKFFDAIYPDGVGGVIDRRLSAFPITLEDYFKAMSKAENGSMRGMQKLYWTKVGTVTHTANAVYSGGYTKLVSAGQVWSAEFSDWYGIPFSAGDTSLPNSYIIASDGSVYPLGAIAPLALGGMCYISKEAGNVVAKFPAGTYHVVVANDVGPSVSGSYLQTDVIGDPANILQVDALKEGWMGSWLGIPNGAKRYKDFQLSRSIVGGLTLSSQPYTLDNGVTWQTIGIAISDVTNSPTSDLIIQSNHVGVWSYTASAKVTKPSSVLPVYGHRNGLGSVIQLQDYRPNIGSLIAESLMGKVLTSSTASIRYGTRKLISDYVWSDGLLYPASGYLLEHHQITLSSPDSNSPAIKILPHAVSNKGQATLAFVWNELKHNGAGWGDDSFMRVIGGTGTYNNLNGESCLYGYAELALPIGWVDNRARFGTQVQGVDL